MRKEPKKEEPKKEEATTTPENPPTYAETEMRRRHEETAISYGELLQLTAGSNNGNL